MRTVRYSGRLGGGVSTRGGGVYTYPPVDRMTDACENIIFPQLLLRTVGNKAALKLKMRMQQNSY